MGFPEAKWAVDQVVSKVGVQPNNMRSFEAIVLNKTTIGLRFLEPEDSYYSAGGAIAAVTKGVVIRMSTEDYPKSISDGELVINNVELGKYSEEYFEVTNLAEDVRYYFTAFPYSNVGVYNESVNAANKVSEIPSSAEKVSITINIDNAVNFTNTVVTLKNLSVASEASVNVAESKTVRFSVKAGNNYIVTVSDVSGYKVDTLTSEQITAIENNERSITFNFVKGFLYAIKFDNGADGIPSSYEYLEDCKGFTAASKENMNSWAGLRILDNFKPCVIKPGATQPEYYLNKDNYNQRAEGSAAPVLTGDDGDVMVEVHNMWYKVEKDEVNSTATLYVSEVERDGYKSFLGDKDIAYRGVYEATIVDGQMRSVSGVKPKVSTKIGDFRTAAKARGGEYSQNDYYLLRMWQCMYLLLYGTRDSQAGLGSGLTSDTITEVRSTGSTNGNMFCYGSGNTVGIKFLGIENFYGNAYEYVDGALVINYQPKFTEDSSKYSDDGAGYEIALDNAFTMNDNQNFVKSVVATNDAPLFPASTGGSAATYFCDKIYCSTGTRTIAFGGNFGSNSDSGTFHFRMNSEVTSSNSQTSSRLCRKKIY